MGTAWRTLPNSARGRGAHALRRRIGRDQLGVFGLQRLQVAHERVVLGVRNAGIVVDVITDIVLLDLGPQARDRLLA